MYTKKDTHVHAFALGELRNEHNEVRIWSHELEPTISIMITI